MLGYNQVSKSVLGQKMVESMGPKGSKLIMPMRLLHFKLVTVFINNSVILDLYISPKSS